MSTELCDKPTNNGQALWNLTDSPDLPLYNLILFIIFIEALRSAAFLRMHLAGPVGATRVENDVARAFDICDLKDLAFNILS